LYGSWMYAFIMEEFFNFFSYFHIFW
jgi:hypothetical protein